MDEGERRELPHRLPITEDPALAQEDTKAAEAGAAEQIAAPVVLELPPDVYDAYTGAAPGVPSDLTEAQEIFVRAVPPEEQDWIMKSALFISQAIMSSTSLLVGGITAASDYYIRHSTPSPSPAPASSSANPSEPAAPPRMLVLLSSPQAHSTLSRAYAISGQAVRVSQYTMGIVGGMIRRAVGGPGSGQQTPSRAGATSPRPPPYTSTTSLAAIAAGSKPALPPRRSPAPPPDSVEIAASSVEASSHRTVGTMGKVVLSANLLLATVDDSARRVLDVGSERLGAVVNHKYGPAAAHSTNLATHTARNVVLVYIDMRGFARRALITKAGKEWIKSRVENNKNSEDWLWNESHGIRCPGPQASLTSSSHSTLILTIMSLPHTKRICQIIKLKPEAESVYKAIHAVVWPGVLASLARHHIADFSIHYYAPMRLLIANFKYTGADYDADMRGMAEDGWTQLWWKLTDGMQESMVEGATGSGGEAPWWTTLEEVFRFDGEPVR
ncbi:hypothetical protein A0H81_04903 [Grifola frondosa]|uniref:Senescence domain-containing protein n=1 Tax=Grifola frondosa TaxID=5627 RepID=A0A1C7MG20_GRIFR|nr:hypothetical protein A0H81_04903 [Grifola frondosa]